MPRSYFCDMCGLTGYRFRTCGWSAYAEAVHLNTMPRLCFCGICVLAGCHSAHLGGHLRHLRFIILCIARLRTDPSFAINRSILLMPPRFLVGRSLTTARSHLALIDSRSWIAFSSRATISGWRTLQNPGRGTAFSCRISPLSSPPDTAKTPGLPTMATRKTRPRPGRACEITRRYRF